MQLHAAWQRPKAAAEQREELRVVEKESQLAAMMPAASASMAVTVPVGLAALCSNKVAAALRSVGWQCKPVVAADDIRQDKVDAA